MVGGFFFDPRHGRPSRCAHERMPARRGGGGGDNIAEAEGIGPGRGCVRFARAVPAAPRPWVQPLDNGVVTAATAGVKDMEQVGTTALRSTARVRGLHLQACEQRVWWRIEKTKT